MSDLVPDGWKVIELSKLSTKIGDGIHSTPKYTDFSPYPFINGNNLISGQIVIGNKTKFVSESEYAKHKKNLDGKTILMSINGTIGNIAFYQGEEVVLGKSASFISLLPDVPKEFIYYTLQSDYIKKFYDLELTGSTIKNLSLKAIRETPILVPPLPEQQKIAKILTSVDEVIEKTQAQIDKLKDLKTGMMQELLTNGIGNNGKPHTQFKDSPVGRIPAEWEVDFLTKFAEINPKLNQNIDLTDNLNVSFLKMEDVSINAKITNMRIKKYSEVAKGFTKFNNNDVLMAKITPCFENGKGGYVKNLINGVGFGSTEFHVLRAKSKISSHYLFYYINFPSFRLKAEASMCGTGGQRRVQTDFLKTYQIGFPPLNEQKKIANIFISVDKRIENIERRLISQKNIKKALMQDLLTGKIRVKIEPTA